MGNFFGRMALSGLKGKMPNKVWANIMRNLGAKGGPKVKPPTATPRASEVIFKDGRKYNIPTASAAAPSMTAPVVSTPVAPAAQKGFLRKAGGFLGRNVVLPTAVVGGATDVIGSLLPGSANSIANEGKVGGSYQLGLSPTKQLMRKLELGYTNETLGEKRKNLLEEKYGQMAKTAGVYLPSVVDSSNEQIDYAIKEGLRQVARREKRNDLDEAQRRQNQIQMAQLQNNLEVQQLNSDIAMKGYDIQEGLLDRADKRNTLESVLALIALMKQDV